MTNPPTTETTKAGHTRTHPVEVAIRGGMLDAMYAGFMDEVSNDIADTIWESVKKTTVVNCHDDLVAALRACYEMFGDGGDPKRVIAMVEAALAKAGVE